MAQDDSRSKAVLAGLAALALSGLSSDGGNNDDGGDGGGDGGDVPQNQRPTAEFTVSTFNDRIEVDGSASFDPDGAIAAYIWRLEDSSGLVDTSGGKTAAFDGLSDGTYSVTLTVEDRGGLTATTTRQVTVDTFTPAPNSAPDASYVWQTDTDTRSITVTATSTDPDGDALSHTWNLSRDGVFVGGTERGETVTWSDLEDGSYTVQLISEDPDGASDIYWPSEFVTFDSDSTDGGGGGTVPNQEPIAKFDYSTSDGGETLRLDASTSYDPDGSITSYLWEINRNNTSFATKSGRTPTVSILPTGDYDVYLTVEDDDGARAVLHKSFELSDGGGGGGTDGNLAPIASASVTVEGQHVTLNAQGSTDSDGYITRYEWEIVRSDGSLMGSYRGEVVPVPSVAPGDYEAVLTVEDDDGATAQDSNTFTVTEETEEFDHTLSLSAPLARLSEPSLGVTVSSTGTMTAVIGPDPTGSTFQADLTDHNPVEIAYNGDIDLLDWSGGPIQVYRDGTQVDPYDLAGSTGPRYQWLGGTAKVAEVTIYETQAVYDRNGWAPAQTVASHVAGSLRERGVSHDILYQLGPVTSPSQDTSCSEEVTAYNYWAAGLNDGTARDGGTVSGPLYVRREDANLLLTDADGGGCGSVGGAIAVSGARNVDFTRSFDSGARYTDLASGETFAAMHEIGHNLGYSHTNGGGKGWYETDTSPVVGTTYEWHHTPCVPNPGLTNRCGFDVEARDPNKEGMSWQHLYYTECSAQQFEMGISGGLSGGTQGARHRRHEVDCPICNGE